jgi:hypothetical protein
MFSGSGLSADKYQNIYRRILKKFYQKSKKDQVNISRMYPAAGQCRIPSAVPSAIQTRISASV